MKRSLSHPPSRHFPRIAVFLFLISLLSVTAKAAEDAASVSIPKVYADQVQPLLSKYCSGCHGGWEHEAGIDLDQYKTLSTILRDRDTWGKISEMVEFGAMPPEDEPMPSEKERELIVGWINGLLKLDCSKIRDPGRVTIRRLNRAEYDNTIRDLLGLDLELSEDFPSDDVGEGFDNIGDVLSLPPLLFEKYVNAAEQAAEAAIVADAATGKIQHREQRDLTGVGSANLSDYGVYSLASYGLVSGEFDFPRDGKYVLRVEAGAQQAGDEKAKVEFSLDGKRVHVSEVDASPDNMDTYDVTIDGAKGRHRLSAAFINDYYNPQASNPKDRDRNLYIRSLEVVGPVDRRVDELPESHRKIVIAVPGEKVSVQEAAEQVLERFATQAFRRPVRTDEVQRLVSLVESTVKNGDTYERGIQLAVTATLVSPHFLFRIEQDPSPNDPSQVRKLNDYELATRLSYFLWSSMPDSELSDLAARGELQRPDVLAKQVQRMLKDPKAEALVTNFASQWLNLRNLDDMTPDTQRFSTFGPELRRDMQRETELLFATVMRDDRSIIDFLTADFSFMNQRLAEHYGIANVRGEAFQRVALPASQRAGLLTHASILTLTSNPTRTSAVKRGKWIMDNILGTPPPEPPPGVPTLEEAKASRPNATFREQLTIHRENPVCASCHVMMDDLGFGFENFDPIGRWREKEGGRPIDATGQLPSGESFDGPIELVKILSQRERAFAEAMSRRMLTYALGRGLEYYDQCAIDALVKKIEQDDYRFSTLVLGIVSSEPFQKRRGEGVDK